MPDSDPAEPGTTEAKVSLVSQDKVRVEFMIDDLVQQVQAQGIAPIPGCNGCNACSKS